MIGLCLLLTVVAVVAVRGLLRRRRNRPDPDWQPCGYHYTTPGFDQRLHAVAAKKRQREDRIRQSAAKVASTPAGGER